MTPDDPQPEERRTGIAMLTDFHLIRAAQMVVALGVLCAMLYIAAPILIPTMLAVFLSYVLSPPVSALVKLRFPGTNFQMPRAFAVLIVVSLAVGLLTVLGIFIVNEVVQFASELPRYEDQISSNLANIRDRLMDMQSQLELYLQELRAEQGAPTLDPQAPPPEPPPTQDVSGLIEQTSSLWSSVTGYVFGSITSLLTFTGQALMCLFVLFFILLEGPVLKTKAINLAGDSLKRRRVMLEILHNVNEDVQRYLFNRVITNAILALVVGGIYWMFGLRYAFLMGVFAGIFNFVPYVGPAVGSVFPVLVAYIQFGSWEPVFWVFFIYAMTTGLEGNILTPIVLGRHLKLNSLAVLLACIFWGWIWGPIGLFLAVPIMAVFKAMSEHVDSIRPVGELLRG